MNDVRNQNAETDGALHAHGETFGKVFDSLMHDLTLTDGAIRLYAHMHWRYGSNHRNFEGQRNIAEMLGVNDRTIRIRLSELEACGWVVSVPRYGKDGSRLSNFYHIFESTAEGLQWRTEQNIQPREIVDTRKARKGIGGLPTHRNLSTGGVSESKYLSPWNLSTDSYPDSGDLDSHLYASPDDSTTLCAADAAPGHFNTENTPAERETHELPTALNAVMEKANGSENDRATRKGSDAVDKDPRTPVPKPPLPPKRSPAARKPKTPKVAQPLQYGDVFAALLETAFGVLSQMVKTGVSSPVPKSTKDRCGKVAKALLRDFPDATEADVRTFAVDWLATHKNISVPLGEDSFPDHFGRWRSWKAKRAVTTDRVPHPLFPNSGATCSVAEARAYENEAAR